MEYLCGGNLLQLLEASEIKLNPLLRLRMCIDIADGLGYLHDLSPVGLVHGNMKTENVLLTESLRCKIAGLGLASPLADHSKLSTIPECLYEEDEDSMIFVDPEFLDNHSKPTSFSRDVYSFSFVVYEMLTRRRPFKAPRDRRSYKNVVLKGERPDISSIIEKTNKYREKKDCKGEARIFEKLTEVMEACWRTNAEERPSMTEVKAELIDLRNKFEATDVLRDASIAVEVLKPKFFNRDRHSLVSIQNYLQPSE